jgi:hypothetical protein
MAYGMGRHVTFGGLKVKSRSWKWQPREFWGTLHRAGVIVVYMVSFSILCMALLLLAIGGWALGKESTWKSRRFSTT